MALQSLIPQSSVQSAQPSKKKGLFFIPQLCDIAEGETLQTQPPTQSIITSLKPILHNKKDIKLNPTAKIFIPSFNTNQTTTTIKSKQPHTTYKKVELFIPKHKPRAKLNIYIGKSQTKQILSYLHESFPSSSAMYFYLDVSTAFQMHDKQMYIYQTIKEPMISFINFDLHKKISNESLYGVVIPNDKNRIKKCNKHNENNVKYTKYLWKLDTCLTAHEIYEIYGIKQSDLPQSSREMHGLQQYISDEKQQYINCSVIDDIIWSDKNNIPQIRKVVKKSSKTKKLKVELKSKNWIKKCKDSWNDFPAIPILIYNDNNDFNGCNYWIEWVKLIKLKHNTKESYIGISFKKIEKNSGKILWNLQSIYFDKSEIFNRYCVFGSRTFSSKYKKYFQQFNVAITDIQWL
eukprot:231691_1